MSPERYGHLLRLVSPLIKKQDTNLRKAILAGERLAVTLRFLASGESQQSLSFAYRIGKSTLSRMLRETCDAIFSVSKDPYLKPPSSKDDWENIEKDFRDFWNMPHVVGAIDGKHMRIQCTKKTTQHHNYKGFFSLVLLSICDARYCFTLFWWCSNNDCGVLNNSEMGHRFQNGQMNLPDAEYLEGCNFDPLPYFFIGDEISLPPPPQNMADATNSWKIELSWANFKLSPIKSQTSHRKYVWL